MIRFPMHSKYLKCDKCENVLDKRATDDFKGVYADTMSRGTFAPNEINELLDYAKSRGWLILNNSHICPACQH